MYSVARVGQAPRLEALGTVRVHITSQPTGHEQQASMKDGKLLRDSATLVVFLSEQHQGGLGGFDKSLEESGGQFSELSHKSSPKR